MSQAILSATAARLWHRDPTSSTGSGSSSASTRSGLQGTSSTGSSTTNHQAITEHFESQKVSRLTRIVLHNSLVLTQKRGESQHVSHERFAPYIRCAYIRVNDVQWRLVIMRVSSSTIGISQQPYIRCARIRISSVQWRFVTLHRTCASSSTIGNGQHDHYQ